jgi:WD40 repeat protein
VLHSGKQLATSGHAEVLIWDMPEGKLARRLSGTPERIASLAAHQNHLAVAGGVPGRSGGVWLVDLEKSRVTKRLVATPDVVTTVVFSPDGKLLAAGGTDNTVRCFDMPSGKLRWETEAHADWVLALAFSPDGKTLVSASRDRTAKVFEVATGDARATHADHETAVTALMFTEDGKQIVSGAADGEIRRWNLQGVSEKSTATRPGRAPVLAMHSHGGRVFLSLADLGLVEHDLKAKKILRRYKGHEARVNTLGVLGEPPLLYSAAHDGELRLWNLTENKEIARFNARP